MRLKRYWFVHSETDLVAVSSKLTCRAVYERGGGEAAGLHLCYCYSEQERDDVIAELFPEGERAKQHAYHRLLMKAVAERGGGPMLP